MSTNEIWDKYIVLRAEYDKSVIDEWVAKPIAYWLGDEKFGSLEEIVFKLNVIDDDHNLVLDMNDTEIEKLCKLRKATIEKLYPENV